jgi:hypothetical protein
MSKMIFECTLCTFKTRKYLTGWRKHVAEESHQRRARERSKHALGEKDKQRSMVVFFGQNDIAMKDVVKYFFDRNIVLDFVFWKERPDFCFVEFLQK